MASSSSNSNLKGDAPAFVPGRCEHSEPQTPLISAPEPQQYYGQQQHLPVPGFYPVNIIYLVNEIYPTNGSYIPPGHYYEHPTAPWFSANTNYIHPMDPFATQLRNVDNVRMGGGTHYHNTNRHYSKEGATAYASRKAKTHRNDKKKGKKEKKYRKADKLEEEDREEDAGKGDEE